QYIMDYSNIKISADTVVEFGELLKTVSPTDMLTLFFNAQAQRASLYTRFNNGFKQYLEDNKLEEYQTLCSNMSTMMSKISKEVIQIEDALRPLRPAWSDKINLMREQEKAKFILTTQYQILKTEIHSNTATKKDENGNEYEMPIAAGSCYHEHIEMCQQQFNQCQQQLNQCVLSINETLEELQYALHDEPEEQPIIANSSETGCQHAGHDVHHH
ncbi:hypothetical protein SAMD00019534_063020, partial [Acytostelium subglobosum LB1]|uniref:hypothetical protein n=1 Tax=Acytostelium subglobosum LB1 TaxID=1410327 RepID=UPI000644EF8C